jgi:hypothetical protein
MVRTMEPNENTVQADEDESTAAHEADRAPTDQESADAEKASSGVDVKEVGEHFEEMNEIGANVKGEGQI